MFLCQAPKTPVNLSAQGGEIMKISGKKNLRSLLVQNNGKT